MTAGLHPIVDIDDPISGREDLGQILGEALPRCTRWTIDLGHQGLKHWRPRRHLHHTGPSVELRCERFELLAHGLCLGESLQAGVVELSQVVIAEVHAVG